MQRRGSEPDRPALPGWSGARHLEALRRHVSTGPGAPWLDAEGYASELLARTGIPARRWSQWVSSALAWAVHPRPGRAPDDGRVVELCCGTRIRLGECAWPLRCESARASLHDEGETEPDPVRVAQRVLEQALALAEVPTELGELPAASIVQLADALLRREEATQQGEIDEPHREDVEAERVRMVLAIHRSLGRTQPSPPHAPPRAEHPRPRWPTPARPATPVLMLPFVPRHPRP